MGVRLVLVKNPWSHKRWKGAYSVNDRARWTPALKEAIGVRRGVCVPCDWGGAAWTCACVIE